MSALKNALRNSALGPVLIGARSAVGAKGRRRRGQGRDDARSATVVERDRSLPEPARERNRQAFVAGHRGPPAVSKHGLVLGLCAGRRVLDIGCVQHTATMSVRNPQWLHRRIAAVAASCTGVDYLDAEVAQLRQEGLDVVAGNVLTDEPPGTYDVVVAGDVIEHVDSPARMLRYISDALEEDGVAVITTPSAFYIGHLWTILFRSRPRLNPEHVLIFDPQTFNGLVDRSPLKVQDFYWLTSDWPPLWDSPNWVARTLIGRTLHTIDRLLMARRPYLHNDFAAVLVHRSATDAQFDAASSGAKSADFHQH